MAHSDHVPGLGDLLKAERDRRKAAGDPRGWTQEEIAEELEVAQGTYSRWEREVMDVDPDRALHERLRAFLGMDRDSYARAAIEHSFRVKERRQ